MTVAALLCLLVTGVSAGPVQAPASMGALEGLAQNGTQAKAGGSPEDASTRAGEGFDGPLAAGWSPFGAEVGPQETPGNKDSGLRPAGDLVVGPAQKVREPKTPLTDDLKPKAKDKKTGGWLTAAAWGLGLGAVAAGIGFLLFGPIGAAIFGGIGLLAGLFFHP